MTLCDQQAWALLIVRLVLGSIYLLHGSQKLFGLFGGTGLSGFVTWLSTMHVPSWLAYLAACTEFIAGVLLFCGIAPDLGALLSIPFLSAAIYLVHLKRGYFSQNNGFEYPLNLMFLALAVIIGGPGKLALWDPFKFWR